MFVVGIGLVSFGYALFYFGWSMSRAYNSRHAADPLGEREGGIPLPQLLGVPTKYGINQPHSFPPFNADIGVQPAAAPTPKKPAKGKGKVMEV